MKIASLQHKKKSFQGYLFAYSSTLFFSWPFISPQSTLAHKHTAACLLFPHTLHRRSSHQLCITGVVQMGWAIISVAELSAMKAIREHPELPLTKSSLSPLNSQLTKTSQASSLGVIIPEAQDRWRNQEKQTHPVVFCMFCLTVYRKKTNIHSSNWKMCSYDSIIIMYLPCFQRVSATPVQWAQFDLQLMRLGL